jgi:hypothetical protein
VDFDGDGILDLVSGSYDPGELYLFRGEGSGQFAAREVIKDRSGRPILKVPNQKDTVESFGSWVALVDWDEDADLDILVGTFDGMMFVRKNEGTRGKSEYATENTWVMVGTKRLRVPGGAHANPVIADWDGDGLWDIVTGSADGGVYWYRNAGKRGQPEFAAPIGLAPKHEGMGYSEVLEPDQAPRPGIRSQIAVADYDGDGKLDVLLGDFCTYMHVKKDLTAEERQSFNEGRKKQAEVSKQLRRASDSLQDRYKAAMQGIPKSEWNTPENLAKWRAMYKEMSESPDYKKSLKDHEDLRKELTKYTEGKKSHNGPDAAHGYVWLFRRK